MATLNLQVGLNADDGLTEYYPVAAPVPTLFNASWGFVQVGCTLIADGYCYNSFFRFTGVSGLSGATINSAYLKPYGNAVDLGTPETLIAADDQESPAAPTTKEEHDGLTRTAAKVTWDDPNLDIADFVSSPDIAAVIQELADDYDPDVIQILWDDDLKTDTNDLSKPWSHDGDNAKAAKLDIDYTAAGIGTDEMMAAIGQQTGGGGGSGDIMAHDRKPPEVIAY